jgi:hypothetical protein
MQEIKTAITISASPEQVWSVLTDFSTYKEWNPFIRSISGKLEKGEKLIVRLQIPASKPMIFEPVIIGLEAYREIRWLGKFLFKGIFDGEHYLLISDNGDGTVNFIQGEKFQGMLLPLLKGTLIKTRQGFEGMNQALKQRCERV